MDLWDVATELDAAQMWEEARAIASTILAACQVRTGPQEQVYVRGVFAHNHLV